MILPLSGRAAFVNGFRIHNTASPLNRLLRRVLTGLPGLHVLFPSRVVFPTAEWTDLLADIRRELAEVPFREVSVYVGTAGSANRKLTVQLMDEQHRICGFVKIAGNSVAAGYLQNEYKALQTLGVFSFSRLEIPRRVKIFSQGNRTVLYQENIFDGGRPCPYAIDETILQAALEMAQISPRPESIALFYAEKSRKYRNLAITPPLQNALQSALARLEKHQVPPILIHGDFVPYNIKIKSPHIALIDWEFCRERGFPLHDLFTFVFQGGVYIFRKKPRTLLDELQSPAHPVHATLKRYLQVLQLEPALLGPLLRVYLAEGLHQSLTLRGKAECADNLFMDGLNHLSVR